MDEIVPKKKLCRFSGVRRQAERQRLLNLRNTKEMEMEIRDLRMEVCVLYPELQGAVIARRMDEPTRETIPPFPKELNDPTTPLPPMEIKRLKDERARILRQGSDRYKIDRYNWLVSEKKWLLGLKANGREADMIEFLDGINFVQPPPLVPPPVKKL
jgi:hypothetical protein